MYLHVRGNAEIIDRSFFCRLRHFRTSGTCIHLVWCSLTVWRELQFARKGLYIRFRRSLNPLVSFMAMLLNIQFIIILIGYVAEFSKASFGNSSKINHNTLLIGLRTLLFSLPTLCQTWKVGRNLKLITSAGLHSLIMLFGSFILSFVLLEVFWGRVVGFTK